MRLGIVLHHHTVTDQAASIIHVITLISKINTYDSVDYEVALSGFAYPETYVFEGFENTTFPPTGWANLGSWSRYTYTVYEGIGSAYKYSSSTTPYILSTPKLN
ncbi:MAG: hypothetical protein PHQ41_07390, partial [Candidatus Cloacimonetes bacterium]|nr:hypothetical protein [Candidatus Cloacimonadota bacterium]